MAFKKRRREAPQVVVHIGRHKTGTTAIQRMMSANCDLLYENHGILWPLSTSIGQAHRNIGWELMDHKRFDASAGTVQDLQREIADSVANHVVISAENLTYLEASQIEVLRDRLSGWPTRILMWLRPQGQYLQSAWAQSIKTGVITDDFDTFVDRQLSKAGSLDLDYEVFTRRWADVFGDEAVEVMPYDSPDAADHLRDFVHRAVGFVPNDLAWPTGMPNLSPSLKTLEVVRHVVLRLKPDLDAPDILEIARLIRVYADRSGWNDEPLQLIDAALQKRVETLFGDGNEATARRFLHADSLFGPPSNAGDVSRFALDEIDSNEWVDLLAATAGALRLAASNAG